MMGLVFWASYMMLVFSLSMWVAKHPLSVGGAILFLYMFGSAVVGFTISFVVGVFLFLTGVSGMMVAFLYVVALCPNPVFSFSEGGAMSYKYLMMVWVSVSVIFPSVVLCLSTVGSFSVEMGSLAERVQWLRDPCMYSGLAELMPFLGGLLFLCMVSVVSLCGQQKQCLGGHGLGPVKRAYV